MLHDTQFKFRRKNPTLYSCFPFLFTTAVLPHFVATFCGLVIRKHTNQTLRATVAWSYELLSEPERLLFRRLSAFASGWTLEAAEEVCAMAELTTEQILELLHELVNKSLVIVEEETQEAPLLEGQTQTSGHRLRFKMLETLREYGWEQLAKAPQVDATSASEAAIVQDRHLAFFTKMAALIAPILSGKETQIGLEKLEIEHGNLRKALNWGVGEVKTSDELENAPAFTEVKERIVQSLKLGDALFQFWDTMGYFKEGQEWLEKLRNAAEQLKLNPTEELVQIISGAARMAERQADYKRATVLLQESLSVAYQIEDKKGIAYCLNILGNISQRDGNFQQAENCYQKSIEAAHEIGYSLVIAKSLNSLGNINFIQGDHQLARRYYQESLIKWGESGDKRGAGFTIGNLGNIDYIEGNYASAKLYFEQSLEIAREMVDKRGLSSTLNQLALVAMDQEAYEQAESYFEQSLEIAREIGDRQSLAHILGNLANLAYLQENYPLAHTYLQESLNIAREIGDKREIANALTNLGIGAILQGDYRLSRQYYRESLNIRLELKDNRGIGVILFGYCFLPISRAEPSSILPATKLEQACWLAGAATGLFASLHAEIGEPERSLYQKTLETLRQQMGEAAFNTAFEAGKAMSGEEAVTYALAIVD